MQVVAYVHVVLGSRICKLYEIVLVSASLYDDDHVDGLRVCLWTAAANGPIVILLVIYEHGEEWWNDVDRVNLLIRPPELSGNPISRVIW
jgi:hypothetical protein